MGDEFKSPSAREQSNPPFQYFLITDHTSRITGVLQ